MARQAKSHFWGNLSATILAIVALMLSGRVTEIRARGARDSARDTKATAGPVKKTALKPGNRSPVKESARVNTLEGKRDPFKVPPPPRLNGGDELEGTLPPGVRGLVIGQMKLEGTVREDASNSMIAVVTGRTDLAYFLRVHDEVYNGAVTRITPGSIYFAQKRPEAGGRVETREVVLKLGSQRGEAR